MPAQQEAARIYRRITSGDRSKHGYREGLLCQLEDRFNARRGSFSRGERISAESYLLARWTDAERLFAKVKENPVDSDAAESALDSQKRLQDELERMTVHKIVRTSGKSHLFSFMLRNNISPSHVREVASFLSNLLPPGEEFIVKSPAEGLKYEIHPAQPDEFRIGKVGDLELWGFSVADNEQAMQSALAERIPSQVTYAKYNPEEKTYELHGWDYRIWLDQHNVRKTPNGALDHLRKFFEDFGFNFDAFMEDRRELISGGIWKAPSGVYAMGSDREKRASPFVTVHLFYSDKCEDREAISSVTFQGRTLALTMPDGTRFEGLEKLYGKGA